MLKTFYSGRIDVGDYEYAAHLQAWQKNKDRVAQPFAYGEIYPVSRQPEKTIPESPALDKWAHETIPVFTRTGILMEKVTTLSSLYSQSANPAVYSTNPYEVLDSEVNLARDLYIIRRRLIKSGIHHKDIKASNVGIGKDGRWKAIDFGTADAEVDGERPSRTQNQNPDETYIWWQIPYRVNKRLSDAKFHPAVFEKYKLNELSKNPQGLRFYNEPKLILDKIDNAEIPSFSDMKRTLLDEQPERVRKAYRFKSN
ncbi:hypothetical protein N474_13425 [Pseudoalteromonas luteoviolacea CPMOR-2]|uniref:Protein kinase domain-containing protein n=1 Tax=Pseudoalteromonas luteoviolacea DSM 6061 TaxID=1365250 RepID=A0A166UZ77_9GAMM|nr:hypothetical protein [Pseudoalteromonas luteoviolacea]KZN31538.1 hypothetical protein N475_23645 [Pseudoalteromonas luteoviolacea DSM 6061]KZN55895.1 hypothetical protein N474_13425 [Pseudoalteromonas luteoviolacea CPMOR-2]MBE0388201.1 hypothetical protein [Pseudoalteromonas luteoviolacea DSM 6061]